MNKAEYLVFAVFVGVQSFMLQLVDRLIGTHLVSGGHSGFVFIAFQGWAMYFLLGSSMKGAVKCFCGYALGIIFAIIMLGMASILPGLGILTIPVVAFIVVPFMMYFEFAPWCISNVAIFFVGAGAFYGINSYVENIKIWQAAGIVLLYCVFGLVCGWTSIFFRSRVEKNIKWRYIRHMSKLEMLTKINDICLFVKDFQGALKFYTEKFGFKVKRLQPNEEHANYAEFEFHGTAVTLWEKKGLCEVLDHKYIDGGGHHFMIAIKVPKLQDVDDIAKELIENGVKCIKEPTTYGFGSRAAYFQDFERNVWEVFAWEEGNGPGILAADQTE